MRLIFSILLSVCSLLSCAQKNNTELLAEARNKLESKEGVSSILTNKLYDPIHPQSEFRELIKSFAPIGQVAITNSDEPGKKIKVIAVLQDRSGQPLSNTLVYLYQTDSKGWYAADAPHVNMNEGDRRHARIFGYVLTDSLGKFELSTTKPAGYPQSDLPAHIHVEVFRNQRAVLITEFLFDDDERLIGDIRTNAERSRYLIEKPQAAKAPFDQQFSYTVVVPD